MICNRCGGSENVTCRSKHYNLCRDCRQAEYHNKKHSWNFKTAEDRQREMDLLDWTIRAYESYARIIKRYGHGMVTR